MHLAVCSLCSSLSSDACSEYDASLLTFLLNAKFKREIIKVKNYKVKAIKQCRLCFNYMKKIKVINKNKTKNKIFKTIFYRIFKFLNSRTHKSLFLALSILCTLIHRRFFPLDTSSAAYFLNLSMIHTCMFQTIHC